MLEGRGRYVTHSTSCVTKVIFTGDKTDDTLKCNCLWTVLCLRELGYVTPSTPCVTKV